MEHIISAIESVESLDQVTPSRYPRQAEQLGAITESGASGAYSGRVDRAKSGHGVGE